MRLGVRFKLDCLEEGAECRKRGAALHTAARREAVTLQHTSSGSHAACTSLPQKLH